MVRRKIDVEKAWQDRVVISAGLAGALNDLFAFDVANMSWVKLSAIASGRPPVPRSSHGLAFAGSKLYVFGGQAQQGPG